MILRLVTFCALLTNAFYVSAQQEDLLVNDTLRVIHADTLRIDQENQVIDIETYTARFDPRKAILYSAIIPGSGQLYNKKYWKIPLVFGGFAAGIFFIDFYQDRYVKFKFELFFLLNTGDSPSSGFNENQIRKIIDKARRERDFFTILTGLWYIIQLVDAHVDAHLKEFDVNPKLQVSIEPVIQSNPVTGRSTGLALTLKF